MESVMVPNGNLRLNVFYLLALAAAPGSGGSGSIQ